MADLTQVLETLATTVTSFIYPNGTLNPSIAGVNVTIKPGWPVREKLDEILLAGDAMISIFPEQKETVGPVFERFDQANTQSPATISAVVLDSTITISGTVSLPQAIVTIVNGVGYGYALQANDTLDSIATNIAALLPDASAIGNLITVNNFYSLETRISRAYSHSVDLGRMKRSFMLVCWCPTPGIRTILGNAITVYFKTNYRMQLPDNYWSNIFYQQTREVDGLEKQNVFRRDVIIQVLYATTSTENGLTFVWPIANVNE